MYSYKTLEYTALKEVHEAFLEAFFDYQVKIDLPLWRFENMLIRRGCDTSVSMGAFHNEKLVGFILNGLRSWNNKKTAYDTGTGVIPQYRKQGITTAIFENIKEILIKNNVESYLLEVIKTNTAAFELYKKQGFEIVRELECFQLKKSNFNLSLNYEVQRIDKFNDDTWAEVMTFWDFQPSWQNSIDSIKADKEAFAYSIVRHNNGMLGYGIIEKKTGDIPQIAVHKDFRGKGIGKSIISDLIDNTEVEKISILNIDSTCQSTIETLYHLGFEHSVGQYEMVLSL